MIQSFCFDSSYVYLMLRGLVLSSIFGKRVACARDRSDKVKLSWLVCYLSAWSDQITFFFLDNVYRISAFQCIFYCFVTCSVSA